VSPKTVEATLSRAYRKLGIERRAELARALDALDAQAGTSPQM
jgi:DNA-binding CsgD family transcriptional regulator